MMANKITNNKFDEEEAGTNFCLIRFFLANSIINFLMIKIDCNHTHAK